MSYSYLISKLLLLPGIIIGLAFHEFAHALASDRLGDPTPRNLGRLTLSPLPHIDPIGFLLILFAGFGWAKPCPINPRYYRHARRDDIIVSAAGPLMNLFLAFAFAILLKVFYILGLDSYLSSSLSENIYLLFMSTISINVILFIFNLLPVPPLDGFHILADITPAGNYGLIHTLERYSTIILILIIVTPIAGKIINPIYEVVFSVILRILSL